MNRSLLSPLASHLAGAPGVYQAWSGPCDPCHPRAAHHMAQACDCVLVGRCSYGWPLPCLLTTALQDLGLQPQRHPSPNTSSATHHVGTSL